MAKSAFGSQKWSKLDLTKFSDMKFFRLLPMLFLFPLFAVQTDDEEEDKDFPVAEKGEDEEKDPDDDMDEMKMQLDDIAQLHCLYFIETAEASTYTVEIENELGKIFNIYYADLLAMQIQYDLETEHFKNKTAQKEWTEKIKKEISDLMSR